MKSKELLGICADVGGLMLEYGAEIYRAEETVNRIAAAYGYGAEVFALPSCLFLTVDGAGTPLTRTKRLLTRHTNLDRVDKLNALSRFICAEKPEAAQIRRQIEEIKSRPVYGAGVQFLSYFAVGAVFALFFGGGLADSLFAGIAALIVRLVESVVEKERSSVFFKCVLCSALTAAVAVAVSRAGLTSGFDTVIIGASMTMVPGITLTNCMRDFIAGDFFAGLYTFTEAFVVAAGMAVGAASAIAVFVTIL